MTTTTPEPGGGAAEAPDDLMELLQRAPGERHGLTARLAALERLIEIGGERIDGGARLDDDLLGDAMVLLGRAGQRLRLSSDHTVVALAGGTGSGKSSLFNAIAGLDLSPVGVTRPLTMASHACVWGLGGAGALLDWLGIEPRYRYARASALDQGESSLRGLILLDLPDHDSVAALRAREVDRMVGVVDMLVWVLDPQKYADAAVHRRYLEDLAHHGAVMMVVLNQVDRLTEEEIEECQGDLRRLLDSEGLLEPRILTTSAATGAGLDELRKALTEVVADRRAASDRLAADLDRLVGRFVPYMGAEPAPIGRAAVDRLTDALCLAAGVPAIGEALETAEEARGTRYIEWPPARWAARLRGDPLRKMRLGGLREELRGSAGVVVGVQQAEVDNTVAELVDSAVTGLPEPWVRSTRRTARRNAEDLPAALTEALAACTPDTGRVPTWWRSIRVWQLVLVAAALAGVGWLAGLVIFGAMGVGTARSALLTDLTLIPWVILLVAAVLLLGWLTATGCRNVVTLAAARDRESLVARMRGQVTVIARDKIVDPIEHDLREYADFRDQLAVARRMG